MQGEVVERRDIEHQAADLRRQGLFGVVGCADRHAHHHHPFRGDDDASRRCLPHRLRNVVVNEQDSLGLAQFQARQVADDVIVVINVVQQPLPVAGHVDVVREAAPAPWERFRAHRARACRWR